MYVVRLGLSPVPQSDDLSYIARERLEYCLWGGQRVLSLLLPLDCTCLLAHNCIWMWLSYQVQSFSSVPVPAQMHTQWVNWGLCDCRVYESVTGYELKLYDTKWRQSYCRRYDQSYELAGVWSSPVTSRFSREALSSSEYDERTALACIIGATQDVCMDTWV
jgi:hypothetical protein